MAIIEAPPDRQEILKRLDLQKILGSQETLKIIQRANERYLYWDRFKHYPFPDGVSAQEAWAYLKLLRTGNMKAAPFADKLGKAFVYGITDAVLKNLNEIDRGSGGAISTGWPGSLPSKERFIISSLMEEAIASSQLEGAATTRKAAKEMLRSGRKPVDRHERMILNNWQTMQHIRNMRSEPIAPEDILEIHDLVTRGTLQHPTESGALRKRDDIVVEYRGETVHVPPKSAVLPLRLQALCDFANDDGKAGWIHPVVKATMLHFWLAYDHPFVDGNGRTARALFYWYLLSRGYWIFQYLPISRYFIQAPGQYVRAYVYTETDDNDLTYFLVYNLRAIRLALHDVHIFIREKQRELASANQLLRKYRGLNRRQKTVLYHALHHPNAEYAIHAHRNYHGVAYDSARNDLLELEKQGLLSKRKRGKAFVFIPSQKLIARLRRSEAGTA